MASSNGVETIISTMKQWGGSVGVQCNGCLAIVSLVRAESEVCQVCSFLTPVLCVALSYFSIGPHVMALKLHRKCLLLFILRFGSVRALPSQQGFEPSPAAQPHKQEALQISYS